ncbi:zinc finger CCCH domain-containing protein 13 isoform X2 [Gastrolobium bilobum]|uniref:zinc finger CCCH domain-containing protein 13 isoform X2 n=1 Tax=Gastrolobium bilobum TaxID=150636 RepID=UPI002AB2ECAA|nr:zinc finger CCCH domain-containing protein 13 isoform X2 [Gastrolobium bilobum]
MVERKQFKTRLCVLYQRGRCTRQNCSFAHGNAELRRFPASYNGRRDYLGNDLRDKLERRHLSPRRYSPAQDARSRQTTREFSPSRSLEKKSDRRHRRKQGITRQSDISGSLKASDRIQDQVKEGKLLSSGSRNTLEEQLKKVHSDINTLENRKFQLAVYLDESVQEVDSLNSRIQELEAQLCKENEECKRITSRIRKFVREHNHNSQLQDELKRSQVRLQRFGDQLVSDISRIGANEEDLSIDIVSNGENTGLPAIIKHNVEQNDVSPHMKRLHVEQDAVEELKQARTRKRSRWNLDAELNDRGNEGFEAPNNGTEVNRPPDLEGKHKRGKWNSFNNFGSEKLKEPRIEVPSTSMAAHVVDEEVEIELDDGTDINETANTVNENGVAFEVKGVSLMFPPALIPRTNYSQYEGNDEQVDVGVDGRDEEAAGAHVDIV